MRRRKFGSTWYSMPQYSEKPQNWKFVSVPMIYSSNVIVDDSITGEYIGRIELQYKLKTREEFDKEWLDNKFLEVLGRIPKHESTSFKRDGAGIVFLNRIYLTPIEYKQTLRELKLKRILNSY